MKYKETLKAIGIASIIFIVYAYLTYYYYNVGDYLISTIFAIGFGFLIAVWIDIIKKSYKWDINMSNLEKNKEVIEDFFNNLYEEIKKEQEKEENNDEE